MQSTMTVIFLTNKIYSVKNHIKKIHGVVPINIAISSGNQYRADMMKHEAYQWFKFKDAYRHQTQPDDIQCRYEET